jgi:hypothetical protein
MNRNSLALLACALVAAFCFRWVGQTAFAEPMGGTVTELSATYDPSTGKVQITGSATALERGIVVVEIHTPTGALLYFGSATVNLNGDFATSVTVGTLEQGAYTIRSADYAGGVYRSATFAVTKADPPSPPPSDVSGPPSPQTRESQVVSSSGVVTSTTGVVGTMDTSGGATMNVSHADLCDAVTAALEEASKVGAGSVHIEIRGEANSDVTSCRTIIPKLSVDLMATSSVNRLTVSTPVASLSFDERALGKIHESASQDVVVHAALVDRETMTDEVKEVVGDRPVFRFSVTSGNDTISEFSGTVTVSLPYTLQPGEDPDAVVIYRLSSEGEPELVKDCSYDLATGTVAFRTDHFSIYAVGYNEITFADVPQDAWYSRAVRFIAARNITEGVGDGNFAPMEHLTRAQMLVLTMRAYVLPPVEDRDGNFADAGDAYYTGYLAAAKKLGISDGVGDNLFEPDREITSQEMFVMLHRTLVAVNRVPPEKAVNGLSSFEDAATFAPWAQDAAQSLVRAGIIQGAAGRLNPMEIATRARMAQVLFRLFSD